MRVQVNISEKLCKQIDELSDSVGMTRSGFCNMLIVQGVIGYMKSFEFIDSLVDTAKEQTQKALDEQLKVDIEVD